MKTLIISVLLSASSISSAQDFDLSGVINLSWCIGSKIVNENGVVRDCRSTPLTSVCKQFATKKGDNIYIAATCKKN